MSKTQFNRYKLNDLLTGSNRVMSKTELAQKMGVTSQTISRWISGRGEPDDDRICRICKALGVKPDSLVDTIDENPLHQDIYAARLLELIDSQPEHVKAKILGMVAEELDRRRSQGQDQDPQEKQS